MDEKRRPAKAWERISAFILWPVAAPIILVIVAMALVVAWPVILKPGVLTIKCKEGE